MRVSNIFLYLLACQARLRDESPKRWQEILLDRELQDARMRTDNRSDAVGSKDFVYIFDEEGYGLESE